VGEGAALDTSRGGRRIIERPRLTRLLTESESRVMLLVAPAGYGKTTLARQWLADREHVWYQATPASSDVAGLALGIAESVSTIAPAAREHLRAQLKASTDPRSQTHLIVESLAAQLREWPPQIRFVIDDYHLLVGSAEAEVLVETLVERTNIPFLIASRERPTWVTAKRLLYGEVSEFGRTTLAMTHEEAAQALSHSHDEMPGLVSLAEGWPAVIGLAALLPTHAPHSSEEVPETLHEYFADELFQGLDADLRWSLVQLSLAPSIEDHIAQAIFGEQSNSVLARASRSGFLTRSPRGHEMHPLLRQFLRTKLGDFTASAVEDAVRTLGKAYVEAAMWDDAVSIAEEFGLVDVILRVLNEALDATLSDGRVTTVERWLGLGRVLAPTAPVVRLTELEVAFRTGKVAIARESARRLVDSSDYEALASRIYLRAGQISHLDDRLDEAVELLTAAEERAATPVDLRRALWSRFVSLTDLDDRERAAEALEKLEGLPPLGIDDLLRASQARLQWALRWGGLTKALRAAASSLELIDRSEDPITRTGVLQTFGVALILAARYTEAEEIARTEIEEAKRFNLDWVLPHALELQAHAAIGHRDFPRALKTLSRVRRLAQGNAHTELNVDVVQARVFLCSGAPERAVTLLEDRQEAATSPGMHGDLLATLGVAMICSGRVDEGTVVLATSEAVTTHLEARTLGAFGRAIASGANNRDQIDKTALRQACDVALATGNFDAFVTAYRACPALLKHLDPGGREVRQLVDLAQNLDPSLVETLGLRPRVSARRTGEDLTPREKEVLGLVSQGLSNRQIARTLWIAESTAKVHVHHVLEKLGVQSRTEAAALASELL
jgi:LuxR family transcriptional regulator, maltose regulon positive regulatory protein